MSVHDRRDKSLHHLQPSVSIRLLCILFRACVIAPELQVHGLPVFLSVTLPTYVAKCVFKCPSCGRKKQVEKGTLYKLEVLGFKQPSGLRCHNHEQHNGKREQNAKYKMMEQHTEMFFERWFVSGRQKQMLIQETRPQTYVCDMVQSRGVRRFALQQACTTNVHV